MTPLTDSFNRRLSYLRLSVTDLCNYRCSYCLPHGYQGKASPDELSLSEIETLVAAFAQSGTRKVRLTGGEATLRRDLPDIIAACRAQPEIEHIALTTNAYRLDKLFPAYRAAAMWTAFLPRVSKSKSTPCCCANMPKPRCPMRWHISKPTLLPCALSN